GKAESVLRLGPQAETAAQDAPSSEAAGPADKMAALSPQDRAEPGRHKERAAALEPIEEIRPEASGEPDAEEQAPLPAQVDEAPAATAAPALQTADELEGLDRELNREMEAMERQLREQVADIEAHLYRL